MKKPTTEQRLSCSAELERRVWSEAQQKAAMQRDLTEALRAALRIAQVIRAVDASYSKGLQDGLKIAIDFAEKRPGSNH
jgi:hypothetical protein